MRLVPQGLSDLVASERGVTFILLTAAVSVLLAKQIATVDQWLEFMKWATVALIASKTVTTAVETIVTKQPQNAPPTPATGKPADATAKPNGKVI